MFPLSRLTQAVSSTKSSEWQHLAEERGEEELGASRGPCRAPFLSDPCRSAGSTSLWETASIWSLPAFRAWSPPHRQML